MSMWQSVKDWLLATPQQPEVIQEKAFTVTGYNPSDYTPMQYLLVHGAGSDSDERWQSDGNSAVFPCLLALCAAAIEPTVKVWRLDADGNREPVDTNHPLQSLLDDPHPHLTADELWWWTMWARHVEGNAYLLKVRSGNELTGNVVQLLPISPTVLRPYTEKDSDDFITSYRWNYAPGKWQDIDPSNIIHFRLGVDDLDHRVGLSPLRRLIREIATDQEATKFSESLLKNFAIPGLIVTTPADGAAMTRDQAEDLSDRISARFGGQGRGRVGVLAGGARVEPIGFSPEQLRLDALHHLPESRIAACVGVPPAIAGLQIGLEQTANYASMRQLRENFTEIKLTPLWHLDDAVLNKHLLPEFDSSGMLEIARDLTDVRALQEDVNEQYKRLTEAVTAGWILPDEARSEVGLPPLPEVEEPEAPAPPAPPDEDEDEESEDVMVAAHRLVMAIKANGGNFQDYPALLDAMVELARPGLEADLSEYFDGQRRKIKRRVLEA